MNPLPATCQAAVMTATQAALEFREYPLPAPGHGELLVRVRACTICRSDVHSWTGKRQCPTPIILGHEIVGDVVAMGNGVSQDRAGNMLRIGDRLTWTLHSCCGNCVFCQDYQLPMKCQSLRKYGHDTCEEPPHLTGGFAEYCLLDSGTATLKLPDNLTYSLAAPLNCAAATAMAGLEASQLRTHESVLIQGAGALGCYASAFAKLAGAKNIFVSDINPQALEMVKHFGATCTMNTTQLDADDQVQLIRRHTQGLGVDCALEMAGAPSVVPQGLAALRVGGRYVEIGCSFPAANVEMDMSQILWKRLAICGVHNYDFRHLAAATTSVSQSTELFPYEQLLARAYNFREINQALRFASAGCQGRVVVECSRAEMRLSAW